ncbi:MAG: helix-turn-helix domain-containing protein [Labilithrix sp.]|nr:helix-turn-helix domain-containing protein [Labilithrix sp.]
MSSIRATVTSPRGCARSSISSSSASRRFRPRGSARRSRERRRRRLAPTSVVVIVAVASRPSRDRRDPRRLESFERARIVEALAKCDGNQTRAAALLGITRRMLIRRVERYDLPRPRGPVSSS